MRASAGRPNASVWTALTSGCVAGLLGPNRDQALIAGHGAITREA